MTSSMALTEQMIELDGKLPVFAVQPEDSHNLPAVIVVHEIFGLNDHIKAVARRFAQQSMAVYAPCLFACADNLPADRNDLAAMRAAWSGIPDETLIARMQQVMTLAKSNPAIDQQRIGTIGFCMGGAIAFMFACKTAEVAWCADYYGRVYYPELTDTKPKHPLDYADTLNCPVLGIFAGVDELIPPAHIAELEDRLNSRGKLFKIQVYADASHAFFNDTREFYHPAAAADAWKTTLEFASGVTRS